MTTTTRITEFEALDIAQSVLLSAGANKETARSVACACVDAQMDGRSAHGLAHLSVYCEALRDGRADPNPDVTLEWITPVLAKADAGSGIPHPVFDLVFDDLIDATRKFGISLFGMRGGFTCGALGYFARRLARQELVAMAFTNCGPAMVAGSGGSKAVFCTNPIAFAVPQQDGPPLLIDQATSQSALMNIRKARDDGQPIPEGWALDHTGNPTTDPEAALKGMLLSFGGARGANIALLVEIMAAGLNGAQWSLDAPSFAEGSTPLGIGLTIIAIDPALTFGGDFLTHSRDYFDRLAAHHVYLPGLGPEKQRETSESPGVLVESDLLKRLREQCS
jgi:(2R)-3-sulfolactate dehydrogenase (NADP+)